MIDWFSTQTNIYEIDGENKSKTKLIKFCKNEVKVRF